MNEVICHGIPDARALQDGDIVNLDVTVFLDGVHGDTNATFLVGDVDEESQQLVRVTEQCMWRGIEAVVPGRPISDIGRAIEDTARQHRYGVVRSFIGHGIGEQFHTDLQILHYYDPRANTVMRPGMTFTVEPTWTKGPGGSSASTPLVCFSMSTSGAGGRRLIMSQVTIAWLGTSPLNPPLVAVKPGSGRSVGFCGVRNVHLVAETSFT